MCGIIGYIGYQMASSIILDGLKRLEYRGYDSAGIAVLSPSGSIELRREVGKLKNLAKEIAENPVIGTIGIGHTRWATHGRPTVFNAHPHSSQDGKLVVVHNGIIENYLELKEKLKKKYEFKSDTDTEVVAHLIYDHYQGDLYQAVNEALKKIHGAYAISVVHADNPDYFVVAKTASPLIIGIGENENFVASDVPAILNQTRDIIYLDDGELARIYRDRVEVFDLAGNEISKKISKISWNISDAEKGGYAHFMLKEIHEQPGAIAQAMAGRISDSEGKIYLDELNISEPELTDINRICILACGTSYYAGQIGKYYLESIAKIPVDVDLASEFRYREPFVDQKTLVVAISQSGETADTLAAIKLAKEKGAKTAGVINVIGSSISRETDGNIYIHCGPEIGVASTKAFTSTIVCLYLLSLYFAQVKKSVTVDYLNKSIISLKALPGIMEKVLKNKEKEIKSFANKLANYSDCLYLGRNYNYPIALEGALKLKELSYIHAEGYAAGEMKHGPIALIDKEMPVVAIATESSTFDKVLSNIIEVKARDAVTFVLATEGNESVKESGDYIIYLPPVKEELSPIVNVIPLQLLAYYVSLRKGCDVDQPRNLAKSVTVE